MRSHHETFAPKVRDARDGSDCRVSGACSTLGTVTDPGGTTTSRTSATAWSAAGAVALATTTAVALSALLHRHYLADDLRAHGGLALAVTAGLFLVAASLRLAIFLLTGQSEARVRASALAVVAVALVPMHLWSHSFVDPAGADADELALVGAGRVLSAVVVVTLLLLAIARRRRNDRLYLVAGATWVLALALLALGTTSATWPGATGRVLQLVSVLTAALWFAAAGYATHRTETRPWARTLAPFLMLMGVTEVLVAVDPRVPGPASTAAVLIAGALAVAGVAWALRDLRRAVHDEQRRSAELERDLLTTRDDLASLQQRERRLAHDARGTLAGVRAAMQIWAAATATATDSDSDGAVQLRRAALAEVARLEDALREHRIELGCGPVALDQVVDRGARPAAARGAEIVVTVPALVVLGHATDLELALREVIEHCLLDRPDARLEVSGWSADDQAVVEVAAALRRRPPRPPRLLGVAPDGTTSHAADELGHARHLMRRQSGDLRLDAGACRVRLVIPVCPPPPTVPRQRGDVDTTRVAVVAAR